LVIRAMILVQRETLPVIWEQGLHYPFCKGMLAGQGVNDEGAMEQFGVYPLGGAISFLYL